ncbi:hypothetical protein JQC92_14275 [Shewanella sp. 202IG2-18]|nr:hypothetical protein [Parashewanella hymeniacidonis]MBM7073179.1 hypothetical protein [Parashewanella hymeniacidonis]
MNLNEELLVNSGFGGNEVVIPIIEIDPVTGRPIDRIPVVPTNPEM